MFTNVGISGVSTVFAQNIETHCFKYTLYDSWPARHVDEIAKT